MIRKIIRIDEEKCNGCGLCAKACHEGAIEMIAGKAKLTKENYCDGLGDCLPACPMGAISFEEREAPAYDEKAVLQAKREKSKKHASCPGIRPVLLNHIQHQADSSQKSGKSPLQNTRPSQIEPYPNNTNNEGDFAQIPVVQKNTSKLMQWPCQLKLVPVRAPYFDGSALLIAADCTAYAYADFHRDFMQGKVTLIGCPKLDACDYAEKLTQIFTYNTIQSIQVLRMEVPCCGGLENAVKRAILASGKKIPLQIVTVSTNGKIL